MSDLTGKFGSIESQLAAQHTEMMEALNTIAFALGAPPTIPSINLEDIHTQLTAVIDGIALLYSDTSTFQALLLADVSQINVNSDTLINNSSLNAQRTIAAIYATFCDCATDTPLLAPPIDITPTELVDEAKCRRIQFYLSLFGNWLNKIGNYGASGAAITSGTISTLLAIAAADVGLIATGAEVGALAGPPGIIAGAAVGLIAIIVYTLGGSVLIDYANQFNDATLRDNMVQAMYAATNADEGYTAFKTTLLATMDTIPAEVIYTLWWTAWSNDVYSGSPVVDDSAFDGEICAPAPPEVITEDCIDAVNAVHSGSYDSGLISYVGYTHVRLGGANLEGGSISLYVDDVLVFSFDPNGGSENLWIGTGTNVRVITAAPVDTYVRLRFCTGTYG